MQNAAVVIQFPRQSESESVESLAAELLRAKRALAEAKARMEALEPRLVVALKADGRKSASVTGLGRVSLVVTAPGARVDQKAAVAALMAAGIEVPMAPTAGGESLRASLD